jgi:hypothetical protein
VRYEVPAQAGLPIKTKCRLTSNAQVYLQHRCNDASKCDDGGHSDGVEALVQVDGFLGDGREERDGGGEVLVKRPDLLLSHTPQAQLDAQAADLRRWMKRRRRRRWSIAR